MALGAFQLAIQEAPHVAELIQKAKDYFSALFGAGLITAAEQDALHARIDTIAEYARKGQIPPGWEVEPDPEADARQSA